jgi:DNA (cytosine-5)-methyltransferase 1
MSSTPRFVDLFCGAGFGARGAVEGGGVPLLAVDAWELASKTYRANFPQAKVIHGKVEEVNLEALEVGHVDVLLTSPECTAHSIARGAKPGEEKSRETAIGIVPWIKHFKPRWVVVENVNRMKKWDRHDELVRAITTEGYTVSDLLLNSADFGSAQARKRMFLICDRGGTKVTKAQLLAGRKPRVRNAANVIDKGGRYSARPLRTEGRAAATLARAERAIKALGVGQPFLIVYYGSDYAGGWQRLTVPLRTVTTVDRFGLVTWQGKVPHIRMLQPAELSRAMSAHADHSLPFGNRREKVKLCGNGVCAEVMTKIFRWIAIQN